MKCRNQIILCAMATLVLTTFASGTTFSEYRITPSSEIVYYHYPVPTINQFDEVPQQQAFAYKQVQQQVARPNYVTRSGDYQSQRQYSTNPFIPIPQPPQYALFRRQQQQKFQQQQQLQQVTQPEEATEQQFAAPALEQNAFTLALTHQGYKLEQSPGSAVRYGSRSLATTDLQSLNVKLPLPLGLTPLNNEPLPLQSGASFDSLPRDVTSYGTKHPLKV